VPQVLQLAVEAVEMSLKQGVQKAMSLYNNRTVELPSSPESQPKKVEEVTS
jgi:PTH1 family peptidyl-tRNA hydrolase